MNCPSRVDADFEDEGHNQNPPDFAADLTTNSDLNGVANSREQRDHRLDPDELQRNDRSPDTPCDDVDDGPRRGAHQGGRAAVRGKGDDVLEVAASPAPFSDEKGKGLPTASRVVAVAPSYSSSTSGTGAAGAANGGLAGRCRDSLAECGRVVKKFAKFVGPGFMVSVAYIDPGNYATDVAAGAAFRYKLLFVILMSNVFAIFLQSLCVKLGTVTGMDLAENCRANFPRWLNYVLYVFAEAAIIATDIAEVIGTAIALNLLLNIPLVAGCAISIVDVLIILLFYRPSGSMRGLRAFEIFVMLLVFGVVVCFCVELSVIRDIDGIEVLKGYLPSATLVKAQGLYQACGILGATVMPHSLYLGSGVVQARLRDFDRKNDSLLLDSDSDMTAEEKYRPSLAAIRSCMAFSMVELGLALFTFALFVNSAILIVAGASLYNNPDAASADLFGIHDLLSSSLAPVAGTVFALALLLSGTSAGIVCTIAGQIVSEGQLNWTVRPWVRRLIVRSISITPSIIIAGAVGKDGLSTALEASQVALSVILPFVSAPLIYFTCRNKFMTVVAERVEPRATAAAAAAAAAANSASAAPTTLSSDKSTAPPGHHAAAQDEEQVSVIEAVKMRNGWIVAGFALLIWGVIVVMNVALLVLVGLGKG